MTRFSNEYPENWTEIATAIKAAASWRCVRCGHPNDAISGHVLTVHHLDGDKSNCRWWNCPALCQRCHLSIQGKVDMNRIWMFDHSSWFMPYVAGRYAWLRGLPDNREYVMANIEDLLDISKLPSIKPLESPGMQSWNEFSGGER
jgi:hypothetical protein